MQSYVKELVNKLFYINSEKKLSGVFALALLATAGYGVNKSMKSDANLSDLALANVEALASGESSSRGCRWAIRETSVGWEAICIRIGGWG